jgi:hypothetical protein
MTRKAQIGFGEIFAIIFIVYLVLMIGLVWYNKISNKNLQEIGDRDFINQAYEKYHYFMNLDVVHVSEQGVIKDQFDYQALLFFKEYTSKTEYGPIKNQLGKAKISVRIFSVTPQQLNPNVKITSLTPEIVLYDNLNTSIEENVQKFPALISIRDTYKNKNYLGLLEVGIPK